MTFNVQLLVSFAKLLESSSSGYLSFAHDFQFCAFGFQAVSSKRVLDHDLQRTFKKKTKDDNFDDIDGGDDNDDEYDYSDDYDHL